MRISVTDRCNLRCVYCMPEEGVTSLPHEDILRFSEITRICRASADLGIHRFKITGGEPLVRKGVASLIREIKAVPGTEQVTMTTNGVSLAEHLGELAEAGLDEVTVSLDTLDRKKYEEITRRDLFDAVWNSIRVTLEDGRIPLKINCVPGAGTDPEGLRKIALLARDYPVHVRFIEMMPIGFGRMFSAVNEEDIIRMLSPVTGGLIPYDIPLGNGPARYYSAEGFSGKIGFISAISHKFCGSCNRIRLTSDGFLKSCLQFQTGEDLRPALREKDDTLLKEMIRKAVEEKPDGHCFGEAHALPGEELKSMFSIGG